MFHYVCFLQDLGILYIAERHFASCLITFDLVSQSFIWATPCFVMLSTLKSCFFSFIMFHHVSEYLIISHHLSSFPSCFSIYPHIASHFTISVLPSFFMTFVVFYHLHDFATIVIIHHHLCIFIISSCSISFLTLDHCHHLRMP